MSNIASEDISSTGPAPSPTQLAQKVAAESIGTFALVFAGCGAIMVDAQTGSLGHLGVSLTFGRVVCVMICAVGHICGAHFNPAVTIAFATSGRFPWRQVPAYLAGQIGAALLASFLLRALLGPIARIGATAPTIGLASAFAVEVVITFFLMFVIISVATDSRAIGSTAGPAIGGTVALCALFAGPLTGASMNPARSLGPAIAAADGTMLWLYFCAPVVGAVLGAAAYRAIRCDDDDNTSADGCC